MFQDSLSKDSFARYFPVKNKIVTDFYEFQGNYDLVKFIDKVKDEYGNDFFNEKAKNAIDFFMERENSTSKRLRHLMFNNFSILENEDVKEQRKKYEEQEKINASIEEFMNLIQQDETLTKLFEC
jgi:hypothetical protein